MKVRLFLEENKKFGSRDTEVSLERTHSQIRIPYWTSNKKGRISLLENKKFGSRYTEILCRTHPFSNKKPSLDHQYERQAAILQGNKKFASPYTAVSVERTPSQIRN